MSTLPVASGRPLAAVFNTYQEEPTGVVASRAVAPSFKKNGTIGWAGSSTNEGSAAPTKPDVAAGPSSPMVP